METQTPNQDALTPRERLSTAIRNARLLYAVGVASAIVWLVAALVSPEEGAAADWIWLTSTIVALIGVLALALGVRATLVDRRARRAAS